MAKYVFLFCLVDCCSENNVVFRKVATEMYRDGQDILVPEAKHSNGTHQDGINLQSLLTRLGDWGFASGYPKKTSMLHIKLRALNVFECNI